MEWKPNYFHFGKLKLAYYDIGPKKQKKVWILAHANGYCSKAYQYYIQKLKETGVRIVALDFAGHGLSEGTLDFRNWDFYRDQLIALMDYLNLPPVVGLGHSMGGACLLRIAAKFPERFHAIVALDPTFLFWRALLYMVFFPAPLAKSALKRNNFFKSAELVDRFLKRTPPYLKFSKEARDGYRDCGFLVEKEGYVLATSPQLEAKNYNSVGTFSLLQYRKIQTPVHFILPKKSRVCPLNKAKKIVQKNPKSTIEILPYEEHLFPFIYPQEVFQLITTKLGDLLPLPSPKQNKSPLYKQKSPKNSQKVAQNQKLKQKD